MIFTTMFYFVIRRNGISWVAFTEEQGVNTDVYKIILDIDRVGSQSFSNVKEV